MKHFLDWVRVIVVAMLAVGAGGLGAGCGGGGATYQTTNNTQTLGRELQDLQESYDKGIITKKQYEETKKDLIKKHTR